MFTTPTKHTTPGKDTVYLNSKQKKNLIKLLNKPVNAKSLSIYPDEILKMVQTNWQLLIFIHNLECEITIEDMINHLDLNEPIPHLPNNLIRLTIPMPDYSLLP